MKNFSCPEHAQLRSLGENGILRYVADSIIWHFDTYLELGFFDTRLVTIGAEKVRVVLKKSILFLPEQSASIQKFSFEAAGGQAKIVYDLRCNPLNFDGFVDCLNDLGQELDVLRLIAGAAQGSHLIGEFPRHDPSEHNYVTILDGDAQWDVFITRHGNEGRYSISKHTGEIFGMMHTALRRNRARRIPGPE